MTPWSKPAASADAIGFTVRGADARVDEQGRLVLTTPSGSELVQRAPVVFQEGVNGQRESVSGRFQLREDGAVGFQLGSYDHTRDLVIDPTLAYEVFPLIPNNVYLRSRFDSSGNVFLAGVQSNGVVDLAAVTKVDSSGNIAWTTSIGGTGKTSRWPVCEQRRARISPSIPAALSYSSGTRQRPISQPPPAAFQTAVGDDSWADVFLAKLSADGTAAGLLHVLGGERRGVSGERWRSTRITTSRWSSAAPSRTTSRSLGRTTAAYRATTTCSSRGSTRPARRSFSARTWGYRVSICRGTRQKCGCGIDRVCHRGRRYFQSRLSQGSIGRRATRAFRTRASVY